MNQLENDVFLEKRNEKIILNFRSKKSLNLINGDIKLLTHSTHISSDKSNKVIELPPNSMLLAEIFCNYYNLKYEKI